jgi:hypothetical protein
VNNIANGRMEYSCLFEIISQIVLANDGRCNANRSNEKELQPFMVQQI